MFKVGDIVVADKCHYYLTTDGAVCEVIGLSGGRLYVTVISIPEHILLSQNKTMDQIKEDCDRIGGYVVDPSYFNHYRVNYTKLAAKMFPKGHREGDYWVLGE